MAAVRKPVVDGDPEARASLLASVRPCRTSAKPRSIAARPSGLLTSSAMPATSAVSATGVATFRSAVLVTGKGIPWEGGKGALLRGKWGCVAPR